MKSTSLRDKAQIIGWKKIPFDSRGTSAAISTFHMVGGHPMDLQERYFVAIAATICFALITIGFLAFD
jgi:hypothetical protein